ncbi:60S ribosomal protein L3 [Magnaporthiopsis poae ATCC 64411]|uniref:60S ribosomal protein L3 n=1 Tax=Magnaporthiopsis poae (strain ATCC 64411 / 73-15) TaxID=644358 RepID=A0A0C4DYX7_MAGP6|nr:60S ribosomal protein L3 [Magnaporthiopsis poae ATCC 64411]
MKRVCPRRWSGQVLAARPSLSHPPASTRAIATASIPRTRTQIPAAAATASIRQPWTQPRRHQHAAAAEAVYEDPLSPEEGLYPSPLPDRALRSAKLAALHARLSLPAKLPLQTLARTLVDPSADDDPRFNNTNLAYVGHALINYHANEWLVCTYPRLPFSVIVTAAKGYAGAEALARVARSWGVETAAEPGDEVDPGLLQFSVTRPRGVITRWGYVRGHAERIEKFGWNHSLHSRVVMDHALN